MKMFLMISGMCSLLIAFISLAQLALEPIDRIMVFSNHTLGWCVGIFGAAGLFCLLFLLTRQRE
jgi:hypothetical protein